MKTTEDIDVFFYEEGESGVYTDSSSNTHDATCIYDKTIQESFFDQSVIRNNEISVMCKTEEVPDMAINNRLKIRNTNYYIKDYYTLDNEDLTLMFLSKNQV